MPYSADNDPFRGTTGYPSRFGRSSAAVVASDSADITPYTRLLVTAGGTLQVLPVSNADGSWANLGTVAAGFIVPFEVRRVKEGSTATVITIGT